MCHAYFILHIVKVSQAEQIKQEREGEKNGEMSKDEDKNLPKGEEKIGENGNVIKTVDSLPSKDSKRKDAEED